MQVNHHLSFPEGSSINHNILQQFCTVLYQSIDTAICIIQQWGAELSQPKQIWKMHNRFQSIQMTLNSLVFKLIQNIILTKLFPLKFVLSYSCNLFGKFSTALQWILETNFSFKHCVHLLDDFPFFGPPKSSSCYGLLMAFYILAKQIGLPINASKTIFPSTTVLFEIRLPQERLIRLKQQLAKLQNGRSVTLLELQSLIG